MSEETELQAKIAALAGRIHQHKQHPPTPPTPLYARGGYRWSPYGRGRGRGRAPFAGGVHRNLSLHLGGTPGTPQSPEFANVSPSNPATPAPETFVTARGMNKHLMAKEVWEREQKQRLERQEQKRTAQEQRQAFTPNQQQIKSSDQASRTMSVDGIKFEVREDGSKLIRVPDPTTADQETSKKHTVSGIDFFRTKHGNLMRAPVAPVVPGQRIHKKEQCENFTKLGTSFTHHRSAGYAKAKTLRSPLRAKHAGKCPYGPSCNFAHDPTKIAICKDYLYRDSCSAGKNCDLSHDPTYARVPACAHFLRGNCTNSACHYPHVNVSPDAPVCRSFASLGFCAKGLDCGNRHAFECPDYANNGRCANQEKGKCPLPHVDHARTLRKAAQRQAKTGSENESDLSSDEEQDEGSDDDVNVQVDTPEDIVMGLDDDDIHTLPQQQDYVAFR